MTVDMVQNVVALGRENFIAEYAILPRLCTRVRTGARRDDQGMHASQIRPSDADQRQTRGDDQSSPRIDNVGEASPALCTDSCPVFVIVGVGVGVDVVSVALGQSWGRLSRMQNIVQGLFSVQSRDIGESCAGIPGILGVSTLYFSRRSWFAVPAAADSTSSAPPSTDVNCRRRYTASPGSSGQARQSFDVLDDDEGGNMVSSHGQAARC